MKVAAIYARVSSGQQKQENTIASQTAVLLEFAREQGYGVLDEWVIEDEGVSGSSLLRPGLAAAGKTAVIPPKANRKSPCDFDRHLYKARHLIENFFAKLKQFRAIATPTTRPPATFSPPSISLRQRSCSIDDRP